VLASDSAMCKRNESLGSGKCHAAGSSAWRIPAKACGAAALVSSSLKTSKSTMASARLDLIALTEPTLRELTFTRVA